jgi:hypothetical protein
MASTNVNLVNGEQETGYHEVKFDASGLASGVYLYRMQAGNYVETRKLLLVRNPGSYGARKARGFPGFFLRSQLTGERISTEFNQSTLDDVGPWTGSR